jgi:putative DNA primase/helicase
MSSSGTTGTGTPPGSSDGSVRSPGTLQQAAAEEFEQAAGDEIRPLIKWEGGELPRMVSEAEAALIQSGERIYQRGSMVVRVVRRSSMSVRHFLRPVPGTLGIVVCEKPYLVEAMTRAARWRRFDKRSDKEIPINAPEQVAITYLSRGGEWNIPKLWAAISAPTLRPDGTVLQEPGYDEQTGTWYDPCGIDFPRVPEDPTRDNAEAALELLTKAFSSFPFEGESDQSVALALALCSIVRRSLPSAPLGAITAPTPRSGKTLLADCIAILATGVPAPAMQYPEKDEEAAKTALAILTGGDSVVLIDNIERPLQGDWLCSILTSETYRGRVLGRTEMISVPTSTLFLATGNQLVIAGDLRTRTLLCRIDPKCEKPEERAFSTDIRESIMAQRAELVVAGLTLMRAYALSGERADIPPWGGFEHWSDRVRAPLVWLGRQDPCASLRFLERDDPTRVELLQMLEGWSLVFGSDPATASQAVKECEAAVSNELLRDAVKAVAEDRGGTLSAKRLGKWLARHAGRIVDGKQFAKSGELHHAVLWKVAKTVL